MPFSSGVLRAGKVLLLIVALTATYVLSAVLAARVALKAREVRVPALVGDSLNHATEALGDMGLTLKVDETRRLDPKIPVGRIAQQEPPAGALARRGRGVRVWLSAGARVTAVPALVGETERTAQLRLQQDGLQLDALSEIRSNDFPAETVVAQDPAPQPRGASVSVLVNRGDRAATFVMPDLIGVNGVRASDVLRASGFRVAVVAQHPYPGIPPGVVIRQSPQAGFQVSPAEAVSLEVSR